MDYQNGFGGGFQAGSGGGGFMSPGFQSPGADNAEKKSQRSHTTLPVTAAMIENAEYNVTEDTFRFDGIDIHQVKFVGIIREVQEAATNITYKVDDMTGKMVTVKRWLDVDQPVKQGSHSECREDTYVRVFGNMKTFKEGQVRSILAFSIEPITDFNEISHHFINVVYSVLSLQKASKEVAPAAGFSNQQAQFDMGAMDAGLTGANKVVFNFISACTAEQGINITELKNKNRNMSEQQLRNCLEWLSNEGHIYSTIDDDHYRSTSS